MYSFELFYIKINHLLKKVSENYDVGTFCIMFSELKKLICTLRDYEVSLIFDARNYPNILKLH